MSTAVIRQGMAAATSQHATQKKTPFRLPGEPKGPKHNASSFDPLPPEVILDKHRKLNARGDKYKVKEELAGLDLHLIFLITRDVFLIKLSASKKE